MFQWLLNLLESLWVFRDHSRIILSLLQTNIFRGQWIKLQAKTCWIFRISQQIYPHQCLAQCVFVDITFFYFDWRQTPFSSTVPKWATLQLCEKRAYQRSNKSCHIVRYISGQRSHICTFLNQQSYVCVCFHVLYCTNHLRVSLDMNSDSYYKWGQRLCN